MANVYLPELGEEIEKAVVSAWFVKVGDKVAQDDDIVELATDKATFNVAATASGVVKKILVLEGQEAKIGAPLAVIE